MVTVIRAPLRESLAVGIVAAVIKQLAALLVAGHAVALEVGNMKRKRRGPKPRALVTHDPRLDHHAALIGRTPGTQRSGAAPTITEAQDASVAAAIEILTSLAALAVEQSTTTAR